MSKKSALPEALEKLRLPDVWELVPNGSASPTRDGVISSPFRPDKTPSFSITDNLTAWKDFGNGDKRQGVWGFVAACRPSWTKAEIAQYLIRKAGLEDAGTPKISKKQWLAERKAAAQEREAAARRERSAALRVDALQTEKVTRWPDFVREHFYSADPSDDQIQSLAKRRGWPQDWVWSLVESGSLRWPELPWKASRYSALTVEVPEANGQMTVIGYHQRIWSDDKGPAWLFVPWSPRNGGQGLVGRCADYARDRNITPGESLVVPAPFVLGNPLQAKLWILTEGQWDAVTAWGAIHGFHDTFDLPVAVFGLRGASGGPKAFLQIWGALLSRHKPLIWLLPDNDPASIAWDGKGAVVDFSRPPPVRFTDQLRAALGDSVAIKISRVPARIGKDINDWWQQDHENCTNALFLKLTKILKA